MPNSLAPGTSTPPINPFVLANHRVRTVSFVIAFAIFAAYFFDQHVGPLTWGLLLTQFFVYPHLLFWRARRAAHPMDAELKNLLIDAFCFGVWCAAAEFPVWVTFVFFNCVLMNVAFYRNLFGASQAALFFISGVLLWVGVAGWRFEPFTDSLTTQFCIAGFFIYSMMISSAAYQRSINLRDTRRQLRQREQALYTANADLQVQLNENHKLQAQLKEQANRDPLTGLYNRRYLDSTIARELAHAKREGQPLWLMLIDIDHFKAINDTYGHPMGDEVIKGLAHLLHDKARADDVVCRYGGEEFLLLLPNMQQPIALARAEQWRQAFADMVIAHDGLQIRATLSIGMADYPVHGLTQEDLIGNADRALYRAKSQDRNCVVVYSADMLQTRT